MKDSSSLQSSVLPMAGLGRQDLLAWNALRDRDKTLTSPFYSPTYADAVARSGVDVRVCVLRRQGEPVGFFPYQYSTRVQRVLAAGERVGGEMSDYCSLVTAPGLHLSSGVLLRHARLATFSFTHFDESRLECSLRAERPEPGLRIELQDSGATYWQRLAGANKKFVADTERRERRLIADHGALRFCFASTDAGLLCELVARKRRQYAATGVPDALAEPWKRRLLELLFASHEPSCCGVLSTLHAGDTWVASHFGIRAGRVLHYWFPVYNPLLHAQAPGRLLLKTLIEHADRVGISMIDHGAGDSQAKRNFANASHTYYRGVWTRRTVRGVVWRAVQSIGWRVRRRA